MTEHDGGRVVVIGPVQGDVDAPCPGSETIGMTPDMRDADAAIRLVARALGSTPALAEDIDQAARVYPFEDHNPEAPIAETVLTMTGALVALGQTDPAGFKTAMTVALKKLHHTSDHHLFDQTAMGRQSQALDAIAGARQGYRPNLFAYRLRYATTFERVKYWGHDEKVENKFLRRFCPGPKNIVEDLCYWFIHRSTWARWRPVNGRLETSYHPEYATDMDPHTVMGDDWHSYTGLPQIRVAERKKTVIKSNDDLLFAILGFRSSRSLMFGEWIELAKRESIETKVQETKDVDADDSSKITKAIKSVLLWVACVSAVVAAPFVIPMLIRLF